MVKPDVKGEAQKGEHRTQDPRLGTMAALEEIEDDHFGSVRLDNHQSHLGDDLRTGRMMGGNRLELAMELDSLELDSLAQEDLHKVQESVHPNLKEEDQWEGDSPRGEDTLLLHKVNNLGCST